MIHPGVPSPSAHDAPQARPTGEPMSSTLFSRRKLFEAGAAAAAGAGLAAIPGVALAQFPQDRDSELESLFPKGGEERFRLSQQNAYLFLNTMMDAYAQGSTTRLSQSYSDEIGLESTAFVYDNAVEIMARLLRGSGQDVARAQVLGNGLLYAQQIDPAADGRVRQAYFVDHADSQGVFIVPSGFPFFFQGSATGDLENSLRVRMVHEIGLTHPPVRGRID